MTASMQITHPGKIVLFGSGETSPSGQKIFDHLLRQLGNRPRIMLLETPAGFELNSAQVAGRVAEFLQQHLQNYDPQTMVIPARKRGTTFSPDDAQLVEPLLSADMIFMGPGSPTYAVRQLQDSRAWFNLLARHRIGAALAFASAATVAISQYALPVYEIYKVGEDIHWKPGLDLFAQFGLSLVFVPHWNNQDGGKELDTSRCYIGKARFAPLLEQLPHETTVVGIDEKTALYVDLPAQNCTVLGQDGVTVLQGDRERRFGPEETFPLNILGKTQFPNEGEGLPQQVWRQAVEIQAREKEASPPAAVVELSARREEARSRADWPEADRLRDQITELGWQVQDTSNGPALKPNS